MSTKWHSCERSWCGAPPGGRPMCTVRSEGIWAVTVAEMKPAVEVLRNLNVEGLNVKLKRVKLFCPTTWAPTCIINTQWRKLVEFVTAHPDLITLLSSLYDMTLHVRSYRQLYWHCKYYFWCTTPNWLWKTPLYTTYS